MDKFVTYWTMKSSVNAYRHIVVMMSGSELMKNNSTWKLEVNAYLVVYSSFMCSTVLVGLSE